MMRFFRKKTLLLFILCCPCSIPAVLCGGETQTPQNVPAESRAKTYPDKLSGDEASRSGDYAIASSFYQRYRQDAARNNDREALRNAFEREIDVLLRGGLADKAESVLASYERSFVGLNSISLSLWRAHIHLLRRQINEAQTLLSRVLGGLPKNDPRRINALSSMAFVRGQQKKYAEAAKLYTELVQLLSAHEGSPAFSRSVQERCILMQVAAGNLNAAFEGLKAMPLANQSKRDLLALKYLGCYLKMKKDGAGSVAEQWSALEKETPEKEQFFYLTVSLIAEEFFAAKNYASAVSAYRQAFDSAKSALDERDVLSRMADIFEAAGDPASAASLALAQYELYRGNSAEPGVRLRIAELLAAADKNDSALAVYESIFTSLTKPEEMRAAFRTAFELFIQKKAFSHAERLIGIFYRQQNSAERTMDTAELAAQSGKLEYAADLYKSAGEQYKAFRKEAWNRAVLIYSSLKKYDELIAVCSRLLEQYPASPALFYRAEAYEAKKEFAKALADYRLFSSFTDPAVTDDLKAQTGYREGRIYVSQGKPAEAIPCFLTVCRKYAKSEFAPAAGYWLVHCYSLCGDDMNAEKTTWNLMEDYPDSEYTYSAALWLASHYSTAGIDSRVAAALDSAVEQTKYPAIRARALYQKALFAFKQKNYAEAEKNIQILESISPDDQNLSASCYLRGDIMREQGLYEEAVTAYKEAASRRPGSVLEQAACGAAGDCCFAIASKEDKGELYGRALEFYGKILSAEAPLREYYAMALYKTGRSLQATGKTDAAFEKYRQMLYLLPAENASAHPAETFWIVKGAEALIQITENNPVGTAAEHAVAALSWLGKAQIQDPSTVRQRIRVLRRKKYRPLREEIHQQ